MGGKSVFTGASYQAAVAASVLAHMVAETNLNWLEPLTDRPQELLGETGGAGDDLRITFGLERGAVEVQAKRVLSGRRALIETVSEIVKRSWVGDSDMIVLVVGSGSSREITDTFATDLIHHQQGRGDLRAVTLAVLAEVDNADTLFRRLRLVSMDFENLASAGTQAALANLRLVLDNPDDAEAAWDTLVAAAIRVCKGGKIARTQVNSLLRERNFKLRRVGPDAHWELRLDHIRELLEKDRPRTALGVVQELEKELRGKAVGQQVRGRIYNSLGAASNRTGQAQSAVAFFERALEYLPRPSQDVTPPGHESRRGPNWYDTTTNLASALLASDKLDDAAATLEPLLELKPAEMKAWGVALRISYAQGLEFPIPPEISGSAPLREAEGVIALDKGEWHKSSLIFAELVGTGDAAAHVYAWHATALANDALTATDESKQSSLLVAAERAATAAIRRLEDTELERFLVESLVARAAVREALGKTDEAREDYGRIAAIDPANPNLLRRNVREFMDDGNEAGALRVLRDDLVKGSILLLTFRASVRSNIDSEKKAAAVDLRDALNLARAPDVKRRSDDFMAIAELATRIEETDIAEEALAELLDSSTNWLKQVLHARIAFMRERIDEGIEFYKRAQEYASDATDKEKVALELAESLSLSGRVSEAVVLYQGTNAVVPSHRGFRPFVRALMRAERFEEVALLLKQLESDKDAFPGVESLPEWVLRTVVDIAWRREDFTAVIRYVQPLAANTKDIEAQLVLAAAYVNSRQSDSSLPILRTLVARGDLSSRERMQAANLLHASQAWRESASHAFMAWRDSPDDKQIIMNFVGIVAFDHDSLAAEVPTAENDQPSPDLRGSENLREIIPDCWVKLTTDSAPAVEYLIYESPPVDQGRNEYLSTDPQVADLIGRQLGDVVIRNPTKWNERHYRVAEILPAIVFVFRRLISEFESRFPETPFIQQYEIGETPTLESLAPILATLRASQDYSDRIWSEYTSKRLPLALVAIALHRTLAQVVAELTLVGDRLLFVEAPDTSTFEESVREARKSTRIVMTRQSFATLLVMNQLDRVFEKYEVLVPATLLEELSKELDEYANVEKRGRFGMYERGGALGVTELKPGEATDWVNKLRHAVKQLESRGLVVIRPLSALTTKDREWRENLLGASSADAIAVSREERATLYADDWGLRSVAHTEFGVSSFSTAALSTAFLEEGRITADAFEEDTTFLIEINHYFIPIRPATVVAALRKGAKSGQKVMSRLSDPALHLVSAVAVVVNTLRLLGLTPIVAVSLREATVMMLRALLDGRSAHDVIPVFIAHSTRAFSLLPQQMNEVHKATLDVVRAIGLVPRLGG